MSSTRSIFIDSHLPYVPGQRISMRVQGTGDPLLLINGMTRPIQSWDAFAAQLHDRTVISFDAPGVGGSPTPVRPLSIAKFARLAEAVLVAAGFDQADVVGFSHGGAVAQQLAHKSPARVRGLVLASTSCGVGATPGRRRDILRSLGRPLDGSPWPLPDPLGLLWQSLAVSSWSSIPFLGAIQAPTLVVCGSRDRVVPPCNSQVLARRIPGATLVMLSGRGHDLQRGDHANELAAVIEKFLPAIGATQRLRAS
ncbi:MAG: hypothetical protein QOF35_983 [Actinomycetota bacterium]|jgi:pimeloyl-ACP methyl ester carboxylesterase|nr:hypothetical protein [Actinomycetota bacterium]